MSVQSTAPPHEVDARRFGCRPNGSADNKDAFTALAAHVNAISNADGSPVFVTLAPSSEGGRFSYTGNPLVFTRPTILMGYGGAELEYDGTGYTAKFGPSGIDDTNWQLQRVYGAYNLGFTGGASMIHGLYFNDHITEPTIVGCRMIDFGCASGYAMFFQSDNWDINIHDLHWYTNANRSAAKKNMMRVNGYSEAGVSDNSQSRVSMSKVRALHHQTGPGGGVSSGLGIWLDGTVNLLQDVHLSGFEPNIRLGSRASYSRIVDCYFEAFEQVESNYCIEYGDPTGGHDTSAFLTNVNIENCYANCHNVDAGTTIYFIGPTQALTGISSWKVNRNMMSAYDTTRELVKQNNIASQLGNVASDNQGISVIHTKDTNIVNWGGNQGSNPLLRNYENASLYANLQAGGSADQTVGHQYLGYDGSLRAQTYWSPAASRFYISHTGGTKVASLDANGHWRCDGKLLGTGGLGVGNSAAGSTPGTCVKKIEVFDAAGSSLGFVPVYDAIT